MTATDTNTDMNTDTLNLCLSEAPGEDGLGPLHPVPPRKPGTMGGGARPKFEVNYSSDVDWTQRHEKGKA